MNLQQFPQIVTHVSELSCAALLTSCECYSCTIFCRFHVFGHVKNICWFHYLWCNLNTQKSVTRDSLYKPNVLEFFCVPLNTEFLSDLYKRFQLASVYDANVEYQIWCLCCNLFLSYADHRHTIYRPNVKNVTFGFRKSHKV